MPRAILCLAIETSNPAADALHPGEVALAQCEGWGSEASSINVLASQALSSVARHDDALMPAIDRLFRTAGVLRGTLGRITVSAGPGGYSALRIAVSTARMIAEVTGAVCVPVESAAAAAQGSGLVGRFAVLLASKRETVWASVFERSDSGRAQPAAPGMLVDPEGLDLLHDRAPFGAIVADGFLPESFRMLATARSWPVEALHLGATSLLAASLGAPEVAADQLHPLYPREAEAVRKWRELGRSKQG